MCERLDIRIIKILIDWILRLTIDIILFGDQDENIASTVSLVRVDNLKFFKL